MPGLNQHHAEIRSLQRAVLTCRPSISPSSWLSTRSPTPGAPPPADRAAARPSISSKKTIAGAACRALRSSVCNRARSRLGSRPEGE